MSSTDKNKLDDAQKRAVQVLATRRKTDTEKMRRICAMEADRLRERLK